MKKLSLFLSLFLLATPLGMFANEGMWFLMFLERLNHRDMQKWGCN